jgi:hypothetical protein
MKSQPVQSRLTRRRGQSSVEYILIIAAVVAVIFAFGDKFKKGIEGITDGLFTNVKGGVNKLSGGPQ